jgi:hypothetical protein
VVVAAAVIDALASLNLQYPKVSAAKKEELAEARKLLSRANERASGHANARAGAG